MNKFKKIGLTALAGSLASTVAVAGDLNLTGSVVATWVGKDEYTGTGNPLGLNKDMDIGASGELDNGMSWTYNMDISEGFAIATKTLSLNMDSMGTLNLSDSNSAAAGIDDVVPTAWEESWDGASFGPDLAGLDNGAGLAWESPALPLGSAFKIKYEPRDGADLGGDGSAATSTSANGSIMGYKITSSLGVEGLDIGLGYAEGNAQGVTVGAASTATGTEADPWNATGYIKFTMGPVSIGYQQSAEDDGQKRSAGTEYYESEGFGISFAVSDDLTMSYSQLTSTKHEQLYTATNVDADYSSFDIAYSMGATAIKLHHMQGDNQGYNTNTSYDRESTELNISLAF